MFKTAYSNYTGMVYWYMRLEHVTSAVIGANSEWFFMIMMANDIRGWIGPKFSRHLPYSWGKTPEKLTTAMVEGNIIASHLAGTDSIPGWASFPGWGFSGVVPQLSEKCRENIGPIYPRISLAIIIIKKAFITGASDLWCRALEPHIDSTVAYTIDYYASEIIFYF